MLYPERAVIYEHWAIVRIHLKLLGKVLEEKKSTVCEIIIINACRTEITVVKGATTIA